MNDFLKSMLQLWGGLYLVVAFVNWDLFWPWLVDWGNLERFMVVIGLLLTGAIAVGLALEKRDLRRS